MGKTWARLASPPDSQRAPFKRTCAMSRPAFSRARASWIGPRSRRFLCAQKASGRRTASVSRPATRRARSCTRCL
eukprot:1604943-Lingulodinium_polyedra.AAC.1